MRSRAPSPGRACKLSREHRLPETEEATDEIGVIEAIVGPNSPLTGVSAGAYRPLRALSAST